MRTLSKPPPIGLGTPFGDFPDPAQVALFDLAYDLTTAGLLANMPKAFIDAVKARDWAAAAPLSPRPGGPAERDETVKGLLEAAAKP